MDNDFFVPHGYLSDDEAMTDQEEEMEQEKDEIVQVRYAVHEDEVANSCHLVEV